jgi:hypothetical protein
MINSKEQREQQKDEAVKLREGGKHKEALVMFDEVIAWDKENDNKRGLIDVLGHKKIALKLMADNSEGNEKERLMKETETAAKEGLDLAIKEFGDKSGQVATQRAHFASLLNSQEKPEEALKYLKDSLKHLAGSEAHKAWPLGMKAHSEYLLGNYKEALKTLQLAQDKLFEGYEKEVEMDDQAQLKLRVWNSGIMLGYAMVYAKSKKPILAEVYAGAVLATPDPDNILANRKTEAQRILDSLEG